jgi:hypothetical protein
MRQRRTDYGTIILHWALVGALCVAFVTGLRIATEAPDRTWINWLDPLLPASRVWTLHMQAAIVLVAVALAYAVYVVRSGLSRRVRLDKVRLRGLFGRKTARLGSVNVILSWVFFAAMLALIGSGGLLYFGISAGQDAATVHWWTTWVVLGFAGLHILTHFAIGGASQLLRIFRPERLPAPPPQLDAVELLSLLAEQSDRLARQADSAESAPTAARAQPNPLGEPVRLRPAARRAAPPPQQPSARPAQRSAQSRPRNPTFQSNPLVVALAIAITGASALLTADWLAVDRLTLHRIDAVDAPVVDGDTSDRVWRNVRPYSLLTNQGGNLDGKGESRVEIRAVHDGTWAYFLFTWEDPTRSLKQLPLVKEIDGWHLLHNGYENGDEHDYNEDKFSVLLTTTDSILAGDKTFHAGTQPIANAPATMSGRGLHYTNGGYVDVWEWKATNGGPAGWMDDLHFGPPLEPTSAQAQARAPYHGGFAPDPGTVNYAENFTVSPDDAAAGNQLVTPRRLPKDLQAIKGAMGEVSLDPNLGESEGARWFMTEAESDPYSPERDRQIPVGTILPGVIFAGEFSGDRADIRCAARWASGRWALEVVRRLDSKSPYDVALRSGTFMRVAAFDHSQIRHTRHIRPIRLEVE